MTGLLATPEELIELSRSLGASHAREMTNIRLPFAVLVTVSLLLFRLVVVLQRMLFPWSLPKAERA